MTKKQKIENILTLHEKMKKAYFFAPPQKAKSRREYEEYNSKKTTTTHKGQKIEVAQITECSCKNVYYKMTIFVNGSQTKKDVRFLKSMI